MLSRPAECLRGQSAGAKHELGPIGGGFGAGVSGGPGRWAWRRPHPGHHGGGALGVSISDICVSHSTVIDQLAGQQPVGRPERCHARRPAQPAERSSPRAQPNQDRCPVAHLTSQPWCPFNSFRIEFGIIIHKMALGRHHKCSL